MVSSGRKLKRAVIKEELVALTGDFVQAVILNQLLYWTERVNDFDAFLAEEAKRKEAHGEDASLELNNGWIYKKAEELADETMLTVSPNTIRSKLKALVSAGFVSQRTNPRYKWDKTMQYRVNVLYLQEELNNIGYELDGYKPIGKGEKLSDEDAETLARTENSASHDEVSASQNEDISEQYQRLQTEITAETTSNEQDTKKASTPTQKEMEAEFDLLWSLYPRKKGKANALTAYKKCRKNGTEFETVKAGIEAYVEEIKRKKTKADYVMYGSTFFNGMKWLDEYETGSLRPTGTDGARDGLGVEFL